MDREILTNKFFILGLGVIVVAMALFCFSYFPKNRVALGAHIGGINLGNKTKTESKTIIEREVGKLLEKEIAFTYQDGRNTINASTKIKNIVSEYSSNKDVENIFLIGKRKNFLNNVKEKLYSLSGFKNIPLNIKVSNNKLESFLTKNFGIHETPAQNAKVSLGQEEDTFEITHSKNGNLFPRKKIAHAINIKIKRLIPQNVCLSSKTESNNCFSLETTLPDITDNGAEQAATEAENIVKAGPYIIFVNTKSYLINNKKLVSWFYFPEIDNNGTKAITLKLNTNEIEKYLQNIAKENNVDSENPTLSFQNDKLKIVSPPKQGKILKIDKSVKKIKKSILTKENNIILTLSNKDPEITEESIKKLKIESSIAKGTSNFAGSPKNRIHNIRVGASKFNGLLIKPGEIFSFNQNLGQVGPAQGYLPELVIKENKTVPEYGGGMCQVSTTMFRTAVYSGMEVVERRAHAYPVQYYNPQGFDATVYIPSPDLKFKNNTGGYVLIQAEIRGNILNFEFFGHNDGRKVVLKGPYQYAFGSNGSMKARLEQRVYDKNKQLILKKTFYSSYKSPSLFPHPKNPLE
jgi:vancomycin resistance protein YoaR